MSDIRPMTLEDYDDIIAGFPAALGGRKPRVVEPLVTDFGQLTPEHVEIMRVHMESGKTLGVSAPDLKAIRNTHHRLAQLLAMGMDETKAARLCNYTQYRVSVLKANPAFSELLAYYADQVEEEFSDFVTAAANLSMDFLGRLQEMLDETPEKFTPATVLEAIKTLADRSGNAPVAKSVSVSVTANMGDRLKAARERANLLLRGDAGGE